MDREEALDELDRATASLTLAQLTEAALNCEARADELASMAQWSIAAAGEAERDYGEPATALALVTDAGAQLAGARSYRQGSVAIRAIIARRTAR